ncbi:MAG: DUF4428 domain-containing protein [Oscillospiraceae bacterium]
MGLFGKLFEKKICSICGGEIGLLGNRKLEDGNMCKECAKKLSPWFSDRRSSTVEQIQEQLAYREDNKQAVDAFHTTRTLGVGTKVLLDEDAHKFMVTSSRNLKEANPDVLDYSQVTGCRVDVEEDKDEIKREGPDGTEISYVPPRYIYKYDFYVTINVNTPYFDEIRFRINNSTIEIEPPVGGAPRRNVPPAVGGAAMKGVLAAAGASPRPAVGGNLRFDPRDNVDYRECEEIGREIKEILTGVRQQVRDDIEAAAAPKIAVTCPYCGATTIPDQNGCCEFCGGAING